MSITISKFQSAKGNCSIIVVIPNLLLAKIIDSETKDSSTITKRKFFFITMNYYIEQTDKNYRHVLIRLNDVK